MVLDTEPTANVVVTVAGHSGTDVTPNPTTLTFTSTTWSTAQTVTVTAGDDADTTDDTVALTHSAASADSGYSGIAIPSVAVTVSDNDTARVTGLTVTPGNAQLAVNWTAVDNATGYKVQWKSGSQGYNTGNRQSTVTSGSTTSHTITGLANGTEYTVQVSATRTGANDGPASAEKTGTPAVPTAPGVTVSKTALTVTEQDSTGNSYTVVLDTEPTANVVVTVAGHSGTDVTANPTTLTFTASNWSTVQTVTVTAGDDADTTDDTVALTHSAASADSGYSGIAIPSVAVTVSDNDTAQVTGLTVTSGNAQLAVNWTAVGNATGYKVQWKSGSQDYDTGNRQFTVTSGSTTSHTIRGLANGTEYTVRVSATRTGANDGPASAEKTGTPAVPTAPGVTVSTTALTVTEQDSTGNSYTVVLDTEPTANVTVTVAGHAGTDVTPNPTTLTFTSTIWSTAQTVTVTAGDDADTTDDSVALTHSAASADSGYSGIAIAGVAVTVSDNDTAGICQRTPAVIAAILNKISSVSDCANVTDTHLAAITGGLPLSNRNVTALAAGDFAGLGALTTLRLHDNALTTLPDGVFAGLDALTTLRLHDNALTTLPDGVFAPLTALTTLNLYNNALPTLPDGVFAGLDALTTLSLSNSGLATLPAGVFAPLTALTWLSLSDNDLTALPAGVFVPLTALTKLRLHNNALTALPAGVFAGLNTLTTLWLNDNALTALPAGVFAGLDMLTTLWLDDNALTALPDDVFEPLTALTELKLANNSGGPFGPDAVALPDDGTVSNAGGTVTLDGSGSNGGAWGTNVTYGWALTNPASGVAVTFDDDTSVTPKVTVTSLPEDTELTFTLTVTGRGGTNGIRRGTDTATVTATASPASDDATLESLTVSDGTSDLTLAPPFAPGTFVYAAEVANAVTMVTLTAETTDDGASVSAVTLAGTAIADNDFTDGIMVPSLLVGDNAIMVRVTAEDTSTTRTYEVTVTRATPPGVTVSRTALTVTEQDTTGDSYTVVLDTQPTANVTVTVAGHAGTDVTPNPTTLTFTTSNWDTVQTVTVTAGDDADTTDDTVALTHSAASADSGYSGIAIPSVAVTVSDNDTAQVTGLTVTPGNAQLAVNWTAVDNATGYKVQWKSGSQGYNTGNRQSTVTSGSTTSHTITGLANGTEYTVRVSATRTGANDGPASAEKTGTPAVPTAPGVTVSKTALTVTEQDSTGNSYTVALDTEPTANVVVTVAGHAGTDVTPDPATLTFTASNWSTVQTVTVTAGDDADTTDDTVALTHSAASADSGYSGIAIPSVAVTVSDNDTARVTGLTVTPGNAQLAVNWTAVDNATGYKVQWKSGSQGYNTGNRQSTVTSGSTTSHTIRGLANGTEYTVQVSATRTGANDGPASAEKTGTPAVPTAPGVTVSKTALTVTEEDSTGNSYTVVLDTEPTANVTVTVAGHAGTDVTRTPGTLTFTTSNWDTAQTVTVTAGDDADTTDDTVALTHSAASADSGYGGIAIDEVAVTVNDNDTAQVTGLTVASDNARLVMNWTAVDNATGYKVQWKSDGQDYNTGNRQFTIPSGTTTSHTITGLANGTEYTVRVSATRTDANDGPPSAEETGTPAVPTAPGVTVSTTALTVTEQDSTGDSYTVVLDTEPTADVTVTVAGHAGTAVTPTPDSLTFTDQDWNTAQTVTVTAGDDADTTDDSVTLTHSAASTDSGYGGIAIGEVAVTVSDNDTERVTVASGDAQLAVNWTAVDNATGYKVQWKSGGQGYNTGNRQFTVTSGSTTSHTITGLANGTEYTVRVSATRTGANDGPPSAEVQGTPMANTSTNMEPLTLTVEAVRDMVERGAKPVSYRIVMSRRTPGVEVGTVYRYEGEFVRNALSRTITGISSRGSVLYWEVERDTLDDAVFEADGEFTVRLRPGAGYTLGTPSSATVRILDNDGPGDPPTSPPPVVWLADARVREGPDAELAFSVRLDRAPVETATVDWETLDGSAKAGEDYVADSGTLVFALGETVKTVNVAVLDDAHDEGQEVMLLVLPNAQGAVIGDAVAKGTIENSDRMPTAWLARFGRAASDHVVEAVGDRWQGGPQASHLTLGGRQAGQLFGLSGLGGQAGRNTTV